MGAKLKSKTHLQNMFFDFLSRFLRIWLQSLQKGLIWPKKKILGKKSKKISKNAEFHADFESVEKVEKKCNHKKITSKTSLTNMSKSEKSAYFRYVFANNFLWVHFFKTFSTDSKSVWNKNLFALISIFCTLWLQIRRKRLKKTENLFLWMCLRILIGNHQRVCIRVSPFRLKKFFAYKRNKANLDPFHMCFTISL